MGRKTDETLAALRQQKAQAQKNEDALAKDLTSTRARLRDLERQIAEVEASALGHLAMAAGLHLVDRALVAEAFVSLGMVLEDCPAAPEAVQAYLRCLKGGKEEG